MDYLPVFENVRVTPDVKQYYDLLATDAFSVAFPRQKKDFITVSHLVDYSRNQANIFMKKILIFSIVMLSFCLSSCAVNDETVSSAKRQAEDSQSSVTVGRAIKWSAYCRLEVREVLTAVEAIAQIATDSGGYVETRSVHEDESARMLLRVESKKVNQVLDGIKVLGNELSREVRAEDVTEQMVDIQAKLDNALKLRERLRALLERSTSVEEALSIEKELSRLQIELDKLEGQSKSLSKQVELAIIEVEIEKREILGPLGYVFKGVFWVLQKMFVLN